MAKRIPQIQLGKTDWSNVLKEYETTPAATPSSKISPTNPSLLDPNYIPGKDKLPVKSNNLPAENGINPSLAERELNIPSLGPNPGEIQVMPEITVNANQWKPGDGQERPLTDAEKKQAAKYVGGLPQTSAKDAYAEERTRMQNALEMITKGKMYDPVTAPIVEGAKQVYQGGKQIIDNAGEILPDVAQLLSTEQYPELKSKGETIRGAGNIAAGSFKSILGSLPPVMGLNVVQPFVTKAAGDIGAKLGVKRETAENIANKITPFVFGLPVGIGSLVSEETVSALENAGAFNSFGDEDKKLAKELIQNGLFLGIAEFGGKGAAKLNDFASKKVPEFIAPKSPLGESTPQSDRGLTPEGESLLSAVRRMPEGIEKDVYLNGLRKRFSKAGLDFDALYNEEMTTQQPNTIRALIGDMPKDIKEPLPGSENFEKQTSDLPGVETTKPVIDPEEFSNAVKNGEDLNVPDLLNQRPASIERRQQPQRSITPQDFGEGIEQSGIRDMIGNLDEMPAAQFPARETALKESETPIVEGKAEEPLWHQIQNMPEALLNENPNRGELEFQKKYLADKYANYDPVKHEDFRTNHNEAVKEYRQENPVPLQTEETTPAQKSEGKPGEESLEQYLQKRKEKYLAEGMSEKYINFLLEKQDTHNYLISKKPFLEEEPEQSNDNEPTEAQKEAGNYKMDHVRKDGLDISIENKAGSVRSGTDDTGKPWSVTMNHDYGYIKGSVGKDKDHVDTFLAPDYKENSNAYIVNQTKPDGKFDEHKVMLGFSSPAEAEEAYKSNYEKGKAHFSDIVEMPMDRFKEWVKDPELTKKKATSLISEVVVPPERFYYKKDSKGDGFQIYDKNTGKTVIANIYSEAYNKDLVDQMNEIGDYLSQEEADQLREKHGLGKTKPIGITPAATTPSSEKPTEYKVGDRVVMNSGRHGTVTADKSYGTRITTLYGNAPERHETHKAYEVKSDNGYVHSTESLDSLAPETAKPTNIIPDIKVDGKFEMPRMTLYHIKTERDYVKKDDLKAQRAKKDSIRQSWIKSKETRQKRVDNYLKAWDDWAEKYPEEAAKVQSEEKYYVSGENKPVTNATSSVPPVTNNGITVRKNEQQNGVEIKFDSKPSPEIIGKLKSNGFRWSNANRVWYAKFTDSIMAWAQEQFGKKSEIKADTIKDRISKAHELGKESFESGEPRLLNESLDELTEGLPIPDTHEIEKAYYKGWDEANLSESNDDQLKQRGKEALRKIGDLSEPQINQKVRNVTEHDVEGWEKEAAKKNNLTNTQTLHNISPEGKSDVTKSGNIEGSIGGGEKLSPRSSGEGRTVDGSKQRSGNGSPAENSSGKSDEILRGAEQTPGGDSGIDELQQSAGHLEGQRTSKPNDRDTSGNSRNKLVPDAAAESAGYVENGNYDLRSKEPIRLSKGERIKINAKAKEILSQDKSPYDLTDEEKDILRQYTGEGGLSAGEGKGALNQHYTDYPVIKSMFNAIEQSGFPLSELTKALEPATGAGNFVGMYPKLNWSTVDIDKTNHEVTKALYPGGTHYNMPYELYRSKDFDLIITNVPFLEMRPAEGMRVRPEIKTLHDFYFIHSLDKLKDNGILAFVTSKGTMDKVDDSVRKQMIDQADVLGAYRLPGGTFEKNAHTDVITDIIFLQKRPVGATPTEEQLADNYAFLTSSKTADDLPLSNYYQKNPDHILGDLVIGKNKLYGGKEQYNVEGTADLERIHFDYKPYETSKAGKEIEAEESAENFIPKNYKEFQAWAGENNTIYKMDYDSNYDQNVFADKQTGRVFVKSKTVSFEDVAYKAKIYDSLDWDDPNRGKIILLDELRGLAEEAQGSGLLGVNNNYETFTQRIIDDYKGKYGNLPQKDRDLKKFFKNQNEDTYYLELSSFIKNDWTPESVFSKQTRFESSGVMEITDDSPLADKALANEDIHGEIDLTKAKYLEKKDLGKLLENGYALIGKDKIQNDILYYSGNIYKKVSAARSLITKINDSKLEAQLLKQIDELEDIKPERKTLEDIEIKGNEPWFADFRNRIFPQWRTKNDAKSGRDIITSGYGDIYDNYLNNNQLVPLEVKDRDGNTVKLPEHEIKRRIAEAEEKVKETKQRIKEKVASDTEFLEKVLYEYNARFKNYVKPDYTKAAYSINDVLSEIPKETKNGKPFGLRKNQIDWVVKALYEGKGINAHDVGGGKTFAAITLARVLKKRGVAKKPIFVVPAKTIRKWERDIKFLFPDAKVTNLGNLPSDKRKSLLYNVANNESDYVLISHEGFAQIKLPLEDELRYFNKVIGENLISKEKTGRAKDLEYEKIKQYEKLIREAERDNRLTFDKLGFDSIVADEAHAYKNIGINADLVKYGAGTPFAVNTTPTRFEKDKSGEITKIIKEGHASLQSARSYDFRFKSQYVNDKNNGKNVFLLTATPTPNKPMEVFTMLRHLDADLLHEYGIYSDRDFANQFLRFGAVNNPTKKKGFDNIVRSIVNAQELRSILDRFVDKLSMEQMSWIQLPKADVQTHYLEISDNAHRVFEDIRNRIQRLKTTWKPEPGADTMIAIYSTGRAGSIDPRLYESTHAGVQVFHRDRKSTTDKIELAIRLTSKQAKDDPKSGQIIFLDTAGHDSSHLKKNIHREIKDELVKKGLKPTEIAIISGQEVTNPKTGNERKISGDLLNAAKQELVDLYNEGKIRVIIGTTKSAGEGMDIQVRTTDIHHIDIPYTPSEFIQRNGRGVRYGNENDKVRIHYYFTQGTFDELSYNIVARKRGWNEAIWDKTAQNEIDTTSEMLGGMPSEEEIQLAMERNPIRRRILELEIKRNKLIKDERNTKDGVQRELSRLQYLKDRKESSDEDLEKYLKKRDKVNEEIKDKSKSKDDVVLLKEKRESYNSQLSYLRTFIADYPERLESANRQLKAAENVKADLDKDIAEFSKTYIPQNDIYGAIVLPESEELSIKEKNPNFDFDNERVNADDDEIEAEETPTAESPSENFYIYNKDTGFIKVDGKKLDLSNTGKNIELFTHKNEDDNFVVTEARTGLSLSTKAKLKDAIEEATTKVEDWTQDKIDKLISDSIEKRGISPRFEGDSTQTVSESGLPLQFEGEDIKLSRSKKDLEKIFGIGYEQKARRIEIGLASGRDNSERSERDLHGGRLLPGTRSSESSTEGQSNEQQRPKIHERTVRRDWQSEKVVSHVGLQLSHNYQRDLADSWYIYRDLLTETQHFIGIDSTGKVIGNHALTSNMSGVVVMNFEDVARIVNSLIRAGAKKIVFLHNHPNGIAQPSPDDLSLTKDWAERISESTHGRVTLSDHIIINGKYARIDPITGRVEYANYGNPYTHKYQKDYDRFDRTERPSVNNAQEAAELFAELKYGKGKVALVSADSFNRVMGYEIELKENIDSTEKLSARLNDIIKSQGGSRIFIVGDDADLKAIDQPIKGTITSTAAFKVYGATFSYRNGTPILVKEYDNRLAAKHAIQVRESGVDSPIDSAFERGKEIFNSGKTKFADWRDQMRKDYPDENFHKIFMEVLRNKRDVTSPRNKAGEIIPSKQANLSSIVDQEPTALSKGVATLEEKIPEPGKGHMVYKRERTIIKEKIKEFKKGWEAGKKDTIKELTFLKKLISDYGKEYLPKELSKSEITPVMDKIADAKTIDDVETAFNRIDTIVTNSDKNYLLGNIYNALRTFRPKKEKGILKGKHLTPDEYATLADIRKIVALKPHQVDELTAKLFERIENAGEDFDEAAEEYLYRINLFSNLKEKTPAQLAEANKELQEIIKYGRTVHELTVANRKEKYRATRNEVLKVLTGGKTTEPGEMVSEAAARDKGITRQDVEKWWTKADTEMESLEWLFDKLSKLDKDSKILRSFLNEHFIPSVQESRNNESINIAKEFSGLHDKLVEIYGVDGGKLTRRLNDNLKQQDSGIFVNDPTAGKIELKLSQNEAYKKWMEWQDPTLKPTLEKMGWGEDTFAKIEKWLKPEVKKWAEWQLNEFYPRYYDTVNDVFRKQFFVDLPHNEHYSPVSRDVGGKNTVDDQLLRAKTQYASVLNGHLMSRVRNTRPLRLIDGDTALASHIIMMEHYKNWTDTIRELRAVFQNESVQKAIDQYHGRTARAVLNKFIEDLARGGEDRAVVVRLADKIRGQFSKAVLGVNPVIMLKQMSSMPAFVGEIPSKDFIKGTSEFIMNPVKAVNVLKSSKMMQQRYHRGFERDIIYALKKSVPTQLAGRKNLSDAMMIFIELGDKAASYMGGYSVYRYWRDRSMREGKTEEQAHKKGILEFELSVKRTQQSGEAEDLSDFQRGGSWAKLFTMFMTQPNAYYRQASAAIRNILAGRDRKTAYKKLLVYHFLLPTLFQYVASGFPGLLSNFDNKDKRRLIRAALVGSFNGIFIAGDILETGIDYMLKNINDFSLETAFNMTPVTSQVAPAIKGTAKILQGLWNFVNDGAWNMSTEDFLKAIDELASGSSKAVGVPYDPLKRTYKGVKNIIDNGVKSSEDVLKGIGYSEGALGNTPSGGNKGGLPKGLFRGMRPDEIDRMIKQKNKFGFH